ncbi:MAG TPA: methyltransferase domain-containing protein [Burkholderiales bacterium]|nr:methyltransferase domain-containing protein [Burkholderiales bacterium]
MRALIVGLCFVAGHVFAAEFEPYSGQPGKDVIWVPTPPELVEKMLDMARVTAKDYVIDLGSGDGRNVIAAAKRGAQALGVEYNPDMVALSQRIAAREGVADRAKFVQGDMFEADISRATVLALFLLPDNMRKLKSKFLGLRPGSRIVTNGYEIDGWEAEETGRLGGNCTSWCTAYLYIVPAKVAGTWRLPEGDLRLEQDFRRLSGTLTAHGQSVPIAHARLSGQRITFTAGMNRYEGRVKGREMSGTVKGRSAGHWKAVRAS